MALRVLAGWLARWRAESLDRWLASGGRAGGRVGGRAGGRAFSQLEKFMKKTDAVLAGGGAGAGSSSGVGGEDFEDAKLDSTNIGFQMLRKAGAWGRAALGGSGRTLWF